MGIGTYIIPASERRRIFLTGDICRSRRLGVFSAIHGELPDRPSYSAVRAKLRVLEAKGHVRHEEQARSSKRAKRGGI